jgi:glucan phosphoethanolaminetransferase (alkaline phosphatase superfamily)
MKDLNNTTKLSAFFVAINTYIFFILSAIHFYWAFGGTLWYADVLPTNSAGSKRMNPGVMATFIVAFGLLFLAFITIGNRGIWDKHIRRKYFAYGALVISIIFLIRAIGDFKFIGFFKTIKQTRFAENDTWFFSPLCLFIGIVSLLVFIFNKNEP